MKKIFKLLMALIAGIIFVSATVVKEEMTGEELAQKIDKREQPKTMKATMKMLLIDKRGDKRESASCFGCQIWQFQDPKLPCWRNHEEVKRQGRSQAYQRPYPEAFGVDSCKK